MQPLPDAGAQPGPSEDVDVVAGQPGAGVCDLLGPAAEGQGAGGHGGGAMSERHVLEVSEARRRRWRSVWWNTPIGALALRGVFHATDAWLRDARPGCPAPSRSAISWRVARLALLLECGVRLGDCAGPLGVSERQVRSDYRLLRDVLAAQTERGEIDAAALPAERPPRLVVELARSHSPGLPDRALESDSRPR